MIRKYMLINLLIILLLVAGCSQNENPITEVNQTEEIKVNQDFTNKLRSEKNVIDGQIYEQNGMVIGAIIMNEKTPEDAAKELVNDYVNKLKKKYPGTRVAVSAVANGKNLATVDYDPNQK